MSRLPPLQSRLLRALAAGMASALVLLGVSLVQQVQGQSPSSSRAADDQLRVVSPTFPQGAVGRGVPEGRVLGPSGEILGFDNLPVIPGLPWRIHDAARPRPSVVAPGTVPSAPPSDAIVLFDGKDLSKWAHRGPNGTLVDAKWPVRDGYFESGAKTGSIVTRETFGDVQLHVEFATPSRVEGASQGRGNSGVSFMGFYELQILDSYNNNTYPDGQAAAIYGEWPPLVNVARSPGEWQVYDLVFEAPRFNGDTLVSPGYITAFWNGVLVHNRKQVLGRTSATKTVHSYTPHAAELPLTLQDHNNPVRFRNVWIRRLSGYDRTPNR